jgi:hypothetical protein
VVFPSGDRTSLPVRFRAFLAFGFGICLGFNFVFWINLAGGRSLPLERLRDFPNEPPRRLYVPLFRVCLADTEPEYIPAVQDCVGEI